MEIKILGTGCSKCHALETNVRRALAALDLEAEIIKVTNLAEIMEHDILMTPGLVVDGQVRVFGRVPGADEIAGWLRRDS